jgi:hypothetical protein
MASKFELVCCSASKFELVCCLASKLRSQYVYATVYSLASKLRSQYGYAKAYGSASKYAWPSQSVLRLRWLYVMQLQMLESVGFGWVAR